MNGTNPTFPVTTVSAAPTPEPTPWVKWPPDKRVWAGGIAGVVAWVILSIAAHLGFDIQAILGPVSSGAPDVQGIVSGIIALAVAHWTTPSLQDIVAHINNAVVQVASATPENPTTAVITTEAISDQTSKALAVAGALPTETVDKMINAGMVSSKDLPVHPTLN